MVQAWPVLKETDAEKAGGYDRWQVEEIDAMTILIIVLVALWLLGIGTSYTFGGLIHLLIVFAVIVVLLRVIQGRNPIRG